MAEEANAKTVSRVEYLAAKGRLEREVEGLLGDFGDVAGTPVRRLIHAFVTDRPLGGGSHVVRTEVSWASLGRVPASDAARLAGAISAVSALLESWPLTGSIVK